MQERQLIKKIKGLKQIKPKQDWVYLTKREIFGEEKEEQILSWLFVPIRKPALIVAPLVVLAAVLGGLFVYFNFLPQSIVPIITGPSGNQQEAEEIVVSLEELQLSLEKVTLALNDLKKAKDTNQALVMTEIVKATAKNGQNIVGQMKTEGKFQASLASLGDAYQELGEQASNTQIEMLGALIEDLEQRSLSEEGEERLQKAIEYYNEGKYSEVMILLQRI